MPVATTHPRASVSSRMGMPYISAAAYGAKKHNTPSAINPKLMIAAPSWRRMCAIHGMPSSWSEVLSDWAEFFNWTFACLAGPLPESPSLSSLPSSSFDTSGCRTASPDMRATAVDACRRRKGRRAGSRYFGQRQESEESAELRPCGVSVALAPARSVGRASAAVQCGRARIASAKIVSTVRCMHHWIRGSHVAG
eukprot:6214189-Pleurochrysis_carterae.AAC.3